MIILDLKPALFVVLLGCVATIGGAAVFLRHRSARGGVYSLLEPLPLGLALFNIDGRPLLVNSHARHLFSLFHGSVTPQLGAVLQQLANTSRIDGARSGMIHKPVPLRWWFVPINGAQSALVLSDEQDTHRLQRQQQALVGQLAHELRTPLTALVAHTHVAQHPQTSADLRAASLQTIERETQRMTRLVHDLLELHRLRTIDNLLLQPTNLILVAEGAVAQLILAAEQRNITITFETDKPLPLVLAQSDRLTQVFLNVLDNAIKYCRPGDSISVWLQQHADGVRCNVQDSGPGIAVEILPYVKQQLYRGRTDVAGTGVGLAIVEAILRHHGSTLLIDSATDPAHAGTTCSWTVPYAAA